MLFTRTIRRKMMFFLALVLGMLFTLVGSGISGVSSYRNAVRDLEFSIRHSPRRADLALAVGIAYEPLMLGPAHSPEAMRFQKTSFAERLAHVREEIAEYRRKLDVLPPTDINAMRLVAESLLAKIETTLKQVDVQQKGLEDPERHDQAVAQLLATLNRLQPMIASLPDYQQGLDTTLRHARHAYHTHFGLVCGSSAIVVVLFVSLVRYGYVGIFKPLRRLHRGALRVARGDFDFRVTITSHDEMAELADSFNHMTARFQEITADLDRQVRERCKQLVRTERLAGIGFLAAGVAHEINNPLAAMAMAAESLEYRLSEILAHAPAGEKEVIQQYVRMIQSEAFRCQQITAKLLDFARGQDKVRHRTDLTGIVREVVAMIGHMSKFHDRRIEFARTEPCWAEVNGPEIKQVVLNLVANAMESMDAGRTLHIDVAEQVDQLVLTFRDEGCGMTADVLENLFEPFYTQRKDGKGTGLGLSISQRIIGDHGGTLEAKSDGPGHGSTFLVHLPRKHTKKDSVRIIKAA